MLDNSSWTVRVRASEGFTIATVSVALFSDVFIYSMIVPIMPDVLVKRAGVPEEDVQRWISILLAMFGVFLMIGSPIFGYVSDRSRSRTQLFIFGLIASAASTALFALVTSPIMLVIGRALQGLSSAVVAVVGMAFLADSVDKSHVPTAMGYTSFAITWAIVIGPILGGVVFEKAGYYAAFIIPLVLIFIDIIMRLAVIDRSGYLKSVGRINNSNTDSAPVTQAETTPLLQSYLEQQQSAAATPEPELETHTPDSEATVVNIDSKPIIYYIFAEPRLLTAFLATFYDAIIFTSFEATLPLFVMRTFHWTPTQAGLIFLTLSIPSFAGVLFGKAVERFGCKILGVVGFGLAGIPLTLLALVRGGTMTSDHGDTTQQQVLLIIFLVIIGFGLQIIYLVAMTEISHSITEIEAKHYTDTSDDSGGHDASGLGQGYALCNMAYAGGQFAGPLFGGFLQERLGWVGVNLILGGLTVAMAILTAFFTGRNIFTRRATTGYQEAAVDEVPASSTTVTER